ncbi:MFS transporter [Streptomyces canus]|uniref:MFS transporter n=1 Tax=Streptomyces canus TaxID=58343 RepID=UPI00386892F3|nr:hypothetical protein OH824_38220 [Streptomyces canus]
MSIAPDQECPSPPPAPTGLRRYMVVMSHRTIRWAFLGSLTSRLTQTMTPLALLLFTQEHFGGFGAGGAVVALYSFSASVGFPIVGRLVDHRGAIVLAVAATVNAAGIVTLALAPPQLIWPLTVIAGLFTPPLGAAMRSVFIRRLNRSSEQASAFSLDAISTEVMFITGPALVGVLIATASSLIALLTAATLSLLGTGLFVATAGSVRSGSTRSRTYGCDLRQFVPLLFVVMLQMAAVGLVEVGITARAIELKATSAAGALLALWAAGSVVGGLVFGTRDWPGDVRRQSAVLLGLTSLGFGALSIGQSTTAVCLLMFAAGLALSPAATTLAAMCGLLAPPHMRTEAFTWLASANGLGGAGGFALGGVLISHGSAQTAFVCAAAIPLLALLPMMTLLAKRFSHATTGS